jgi:CDP-6-deoxy-D-xylo-4-hexulose-3-dehydrase
MSDSFWVGVWPGLDEPRLEYIADTLFEVTREIQPAPGHG